MLSLRANLGALASGGARSSSSGARLPLRLPRLRQLSFERPDVSDAAALLSRLAAERPGLLAGLESLDLSSCQGLTPGALAALLAGCTQLRALTLPPFAPGGPSRQEFADVLRCGHACRRCRNSSRSSSVAGTSSCWRWSACLAHPHACADLLLLPWKPLQ